MKKWLTKKNIILLVAVLVVGGGWLIRKQNQSRKDIAVKEVTVEKKDITSVLTVSGKIVADKQVSLNFQTMGKLGFVRAKVGDEVKMGVVIAGLDTGDLDAAVTKAYYSYLAADANAKYVEDTLKGHDNDESFIQKNTRVAAQTTRDTAYDTWLSAQRARRYAYLVAPFNGVVTSSTISGAGDIVGVTDGMTLVDPKSLHFQAEVDESDVAKVKPGQTVALFLDAFPDEKFIGKIKSISFLAKVSSTGATVFETDVEVPGEAGLMFRMGMNGDADIEMASASGVLTLPIEAVVDGKVTLVGGELVEVKTGLEGLSDIEIREGLKEGDKVLVK